MPENNAEGLANGTVPTTANTGGNSGTAASTVSIASGDTLVADTSKDSHGLVSYRFTLSANGTGPTRLFWNYTGTGRVVLSAYFWLDTLPTQVEDLFGIRNSGGNMGIMSIGADGKFSMANSAGTGLTVSKSTINFPTSQWVRVDMSAAPGTTTSNGYLDYAVFTKHGNTPIASWSSNAVNSGTTAVAAVFVGRSTGRVEGRTMWADSIRWQNQTTDWYTTYPKDPGWYVVSSGDEIAAIARGTVIPVNNTYDSALYDTATYG